MKREIDIVVHIPEEALQAIKEGTFDKEYTPIELLGYIQNGTPLNEVFDKIRAEIKSISPKTYPFLNSTDRYVKEDDVLQIIEKYREVGE